MELGVLLVATEGFVGGSSFGVGFIRREEFTHIEYFDVVQVVLFVAGDNDSSLILRQTALLLLEVTQQDALHDLWTEFAFGELVHLLADEDNWDLVVGIVKGTLLLPLVWWWLL